MVAMVEQRFDPALDKEPEWKRLVQTASQYLDDETKDTAWPAVATWSLISDDGPDRVSLYIHDPNLHVWALRTFCKPDLQDLDELEKDIIRLWGTLLQRRSAVRIHKLTQALADEGAGK